MNDRQREVNKIKENNIKRDIEKYGEEFFVLEKERGKYKFSEKQKSYVIKTYNKPYEDATNVAKRFGVSYAFINGRLRDWGEVTKSSSELYKLHKDKYNKSFFQTINSEEKAYWLGFLYADASIAKNYKPPSQKNSKRAGKTYMRISLKGEDVNHLKKLAVSLGLPESRVTTTTNYMSALNRDYTYCTLTVDSVELVDDLINLGIHPAHLLEEDSRKEFMMFPKPPLIPEEFYHHFIRGYFEGDGSLTHIKREGKYINTKHYTVKFLGNEKICNFLKDYFKHETVNSSPNAKNIYQNKDKGFAFSYERGGNHNTFYHLKKMYEGAEIYLDRKKKQVDEFFEYFKERNSELNSRPKSERKNLILT